ncbi:flagellar hook-length control protein FliK [Pseudomonas sp. PSKL.D1]|uniref:flagellar hook-length control protein FliK n=1 Tax=Pseudomonas sp. PSKL.D1 TaxID=3029060 RepID=UPI0023818323|nr:flagellar hook-length control protein FliK [Pseudomonas sp. PSKL.D1]WDY57899.1 flagellar hook-length control protein FliK [Pseudomonas sp. PSKL.D1]
MDIITAISPVAPAEAPAAATDAATAGGATGFDTALSQAQAAQTTAVPAPTLKMATPVEAQVAEPIPVVADAPALPAATAEPQPELPEAPQPQAVTNQPQALTLSLDEPELPPDDEPVSTLAGLQEVSEGDDLATDDSPTQPEDSLEAIRHRLELIDTAGQLASGAVAAPPPVAWSASPATASGVDDAQAEVAAWPQADAQVAAAQAPTGQLEAVMADSVQADAPVSATADGAPSAPADADPALLPNVQAPVMAAAPASSSALASTAQAMPTVGSESWQSDLGQQVVAMVRRGEQKMDMQLNPTDLGPLSISLNVSESGVQAQFHSAHASVRAAVEQALPQLQSALASQGLTLGEASVNDGGSRQAAGEQPRRESQGSGADERSQPVAQAPQMAAVEQVVASRLGVDLYL